MKNKNGFIGLIVILIAAVVFVVWFMYLFNHQWFGRMSVPGIYESAENISQSKKSDSPQIEGQTPLNTQLNNLRNDVEGLQDKKNQEVYEELSK